MLSSQTPTSAPGTLPTASHFDTPRSTVPLLQMAPAADASS